ncbi:MAG: NUDIX hydrolase [Sulfitobacter sp.]
MGQEVRFGGAKVALFVGRALVVLLRDDMPGLPWAGHWDFPGGGREGDESAFECVARECAEELGLSIEKHNIVWQRVFETADGVNWFFVAQLPVGTEAEIVFGNEGQGWQLMEVAEYLSHPRAIPRFQKRLRIALESGA